MAINIFIIDKHEHKIKYLDNFDVLDIINISEEASKNQAKCLSFLDFVGYTIFNNIQIDEIKTEIRYLSDNTKISESIKKMKAIIDSMPEDQNFYLMFHGE
jgi:hypothetical protein